MTPTNTVEWSDEEVVRALKSALLGDDQQLPCPRFRIASHACRTCSILSSCALTFINADWSDEEVLKDLQSALLTRPSPPYGVPKSPYSRPLQLLPVP